jgi:hypothetical protein
MEFPFFCTVLVTITAINSGIVAGGFELLPGWLVHVLPHAGGAKLFSKPLNAFGPAPPLIGLFFTHCAPQKYTVAPVVTFT